MTLSAKTSPVLPEAHHPDDERLALHAAGQLRPVERVIVEAHLAFCATCVERLRGMLEPGARWLRSLDPEPVTAALWSRLEHRLAESGALPASVSAGTGEREPGAGRTESRRPATGAASGRPSRLPAAAWEELDPKPPIRWRPVVTSRARFTLLGSDPVLDADLVMVGLEGGERFPTHRHVGHEDIVVLAGAYTDPSGHFETGAYYRYPPGSEHGPSIDPGEYCFTLGLIQHGLRFRGLLGVLQWLADPRARRARTPVPPAG